ncbi:uncharacterized protein C8Q71DRAFT_13535 [Rhodofomes roseus]|uniref:Uncharacterized protein n=1 Tax=Rhodofomes roseus TaxID=34475 RepID=A0ABQ8KYE9_9APHY|nr:uncharacterized protein C8Q71DRAFT_13535 [Rhodofomes roseus]KAH9843786.1 hypothetical protein C8Q71DRAFT_13535 [Rhodofomes roseus]
MSALHSLTFVLVLTRLLGNLEMTINGFLLYAPLLWEHAMDSYRSVYKYWARSSFIGCHSYLITEVIVSLPPVHHQAASSRRSLKYWSPASWIVFRWQTSASMRPR